MFDFNHDSQKHLQTNKNGWRLCGIFPIVEKCDFFLNEGTFTLASSVQEVPVLGKSLQSLGKALVDL